MIHQTLPGFKVGFTSQRISSFSGLPLVAQVGERFNVWADIDRSVCLKKRRRGHAVSEAVMDIALLMVGGGECLDDLRMLRADEGLKELLGRPGFLAPTTAGEMLRRFSECSLEALGGVNARFVEKAAVREHLTEATVDVDSSVIEAEKKECERAYTGERGYNPLVGFWAEANLALSEMFRPGNASPQADALEFLKRCVRALPKGLERICFRSDSAWYRHDVMDHCEQKGYGFSITADKTQAVRDVIAAIEEHLWEPFEEGAQVAETVHTLEGSERAYRLVVLRREREPGEQLEFFESRYRYHAIITNLDKGAAELVRFHNGRGQSENRIKELKLGLGLHKLPCGQFTANAAYFRIGMLAYNLVEAMRRFALPKGWRRFTLKTLRFRLFRVASVVARHARSLVVRLPVHYPHFEVFDAARLKLSYAPT